ncbi:MAG TPA: iron-containing alcohol dehydrogenase, partial [Candidatus Acidoferrales bacterium]|nr:iron-containing alcohol dehydrogenase [Candidatus Acidoferrales bacterium]
MKFEFATATQIIFGAGAAAHIGDHVKNLGRRALVVTGATPGRAEKLLANLSANGLSSVTFPVKGEPELATVEHGVAVAKRENCGFV